jgi:hypothetical protein
MKFMCISEIGKKENYERRKGRRLRVGRKVLNALCLQPFSLE